MHIRITIAALAVTGLALTGCAAEPSYNEKATACADAIKGGAKVTKTERPAECADITEDDYNILIIGNAIEKSEILNDDGTINFDKLTEEPTEP